MLDTAYYPEIENWQTMMQLSGIANEFDSMTVFCIDQIKSELVPRFSGGGSRGSLSDALVLSDTVPSTTQAAISNTMFFHGTRDQVALTVISGDYDCTPLALSDTVPSKATSASTRGFDSYTE